MALCRKYATLSHARFLKEKGREQILKNKKAAFTVARMKFLLNFQTQKTTKERKIVESFLLLAQSAFLSWSKQKVFSTATSRRMYSTMKSYVILGEGGSSKHHTS